MSAAATAARQRPRRPRERFVPRRGRAQRLFEPGVPTLDDRISANWQALIEAGSAECAVCGTEVQAGSACGGCGSELT